MEGNLGNSALYPGLVPAESLLTSCFCLGKENKPSLGVETSWEMQLESPEPCVYHQPGHPPPVQAAIQQLAGLNRAELAGFLREKGW